MQRCAAFQILQITDGTTTVDLLNTHSGFFATDWTPAVSEIKGDGTWSDSPLADGRKLRVRKRANAMETFEIQARSFEPDMLVRETQELRRLLEKAASYSPTAWTPGPVWIKAQGLGETNARYSLIEDYRAQADNYPYSNQDYFWNKLGQAAFEDWRLVIEREPFWRSVAPGQPCPEEKSESITWTESGCDPSYLTFDGADSVVNCGSDASLDDIPDNAVAGRGQLTADGWIRANGYGETGQGYIVSKRGGGWILQLDSVQGLAGYVLCAAQNAISYSGLDEFTADGLWHHVLMCYDETGADTPAARTIYLAIDGVWVASYPTQQVSIGNYSTDAAGNLLIGDHSVGGHAFDGDIGWVRVSDSIRYDPAGGDFTPDPRCTPPDPSTGTQLLLRHSPGCGVQTDDYSGHNNDGTLTTVLWGCDCLYENTVYPCWPNYLEFNGETSLVTVAAAVSIDDLPDNAIAGNGPMAAEAWIRADGYGEGNQGRIVIKGSDALATRGFHLLVDSAVGILSYVDCATQDAISSSGLDEFTADGEWHHILMTYDEAGGGLPANRTIYLAIDGVWVASYPTQQVSIGNYSVDNGDDLIIGNNAGASGTFDGDIGWVRVHDDIPYDPADGDFTPEPRCELPNIDAGVVLQVIYEGAGATTYDRSGNSNDGAITEAVWDCDCDYTDEDDVECNCVQASGTQEDWRYEELFAIHDANPVGQVHDIIETTSGVLVACEASSNVWRSLDGTAPWAACAAPPAPNVNCQAMLEVGGSTIYLIGTDTGTTLPECWRSVDDGNNWALRNNDITGAGAASFADQNGLAYFGGYLYAAVRGPVTGGVFRSSDGGTTWTRVFSTPLGGCIALFVWEDALYTSSGSGSDVGSIWRSTDGTTWTKVFITDNLSYITVFQEIGDDLFASELVGTLDGPRLYRTSDGINWARVTPDDTVFGVVYGNDIQQLASGSYIMSGSGGNIYESSDGIDWKAIYTIAAPPGEGMVGNYSGNGLAYLGALGQIYILSQSTDVGRDATCLDEVFVANKKNIAQLSNVLVYNSTVAAYTSHFPATLPFFLLPSPFVAGDIVYFGIASNVSEFGPFCSLVFDILQELNGATITIVWEYSQGGAAWNTLNVQDGTMALDPFDRQGVNSVSWVPPDDWATDAVNGVTALWVRARVTAVGTWLQSPIQQHRDVYTVTWPDVDIDDAQVAGDVPALLRIETHNRSDEDGYETVDELDLLDNRIIAGLRGVSRGDGFTSFINLAEDGVVATSYSQNPTGVIVLDGTGTTTIADPRAPAGIACRHTTPPTGSLDIYADVATVTLGPSIARDYYGTFHVFMRAQLEEPAAAPAGDEDGVRVRLLFQTGSGGVYKVTEYRHFTGLDANGEHYKDFQLLDFGRISLPVSGSFNIDELPNEFNIIVQIASEATYNLQVTMYDLCLVPVDEWVGDFVDAAFETDSGVSNGYSLDADSVTYPKRSIRATVRTADASAYIRSIYERVGLSPAILQANADQQLFFLSAAGVCKGYHTGANNSPTLQDGYANFWRSGVKPDMIVYNLTDGSSAVITSIGYDYEITGTLTGGAEDDWDTNDLYLIVCPNWRSDPFALHSVKTEHVARYLSMRGNR
jgi:hypothetical protein